MRQMISILSICCVTLICASAYAQQVESTLYKAWSGHKPGTSTTLSMNSTSAGQNMKMEMKSTLVEVKDDKVILEIATTMDMNGSKTAVPAQKIDIPKMVDTKNTATQQQQIDSDTLAKASEESVTVPAGTFKAKVVEVTMSQNGMNIKSKVWFAPEVPGGTVKMEQTGDGAMKMESKGELIAMEKK